jgi:hypothetical protein
MIDRLRDPVWIGAARGQGAFSPGHGPIINPQSKIPNQSSMKRSPNLQFRRQ